MIYAFINWLAEFVFYYPILMSIVWMVGGLYFFCRRELGKSKTPPELEVTPLVSVFVPAHNEEREIADAVRSRLEDGRLRDESDPVIGTVYWNTEENADE